MSILWISLMVLSCMASTLDQRANSLLYAKDSRDLKIKIHKYEVSKKLESKCEFELLNTLVPKSCYKLRLSHKKIEILNQACERASYIMKEEVDLAGLSESCSKAVNKKNKDIRYRREETQPEELMRGL